MTDKPLPSGVSLHRGKLRLDFRYKAVRCREGLGLLPTAANIKYAERKLAIIQNEIALGAFDYSAHFPESKRALLFGGRPAHRTTVGEALDSWLITAKASCAASTYRDYESAVRVHLKPQFGPRFLGGDDGLRKSEIKTWLAKLEISNKRKNNILIPLRGVYQDALDDDIIDRSPVGNLRNLEVRQDEPDPFSRAEIDKLLNACKSTEDWAIWCFAFWTGLRTSELLALAWDDVDLSAGVVRVRRAKVRREFKAPKTASGARDVKLLPPALAALEAMRPISSMRGAEAVTVKREGKTEKQSLRLVFLAPFTGEPWADDQSLRKRSWMPLIARTKLRYRNPYQTRHSFASNLLSAGANPMWVAYQMGHKDWGMIRRRYGRWIPDQSGANERVVVETLSLGLAPNWSPPKAASE